MILDDGMAEGGRFGEEVGIEVAAAEGCLRTIDGGFQQSLISNPTRSSRRFDNPLVQEEYLIGVKVIQALERR